MIVDEETGEILEYERVPYEHVEDYPKTLFLCDVRSVDDMEDFMSTMIDKRKIRGSNHNDLLVFFERCLGYKVLKHEIFEHCGSLSVPQYKLLDSLGELVEYKNVIMVTRKHLCQHLNCQDNNLMKKLKSVEGYIKVYTQDDGIRKGEIKILVNPKFFYIYEYSLYDKSRDKAIKQWYQDVLEKQSTLD